MKHEAAANSEYCRTASWLRLRAVLYYALMHCYASCTMRPFVLVHTAHKESRGCNLIGVHTWLQSETCARQIKRSTPPQLLMLNKVKEVAALFVGQPAAGHVSNIAFLQWQQVQQHRHSTFACMRQWSMHQLPDVNVVKCCHTSTQSTFMLATPVKVAGAHQPICLSSSHAQYGTWTP